MKNLCAVKQKSNAVNSPERFLDCRLVGGSPVAPYAVQVHAGTNLIDDNVSKSQVGCWSCVLHQDSWAGLEFSLAAAGTFHLNSFPASCIPHASSECFFMLFIF